MQVAGSVAVRAGDPPDPLCDNAASVVVRYRLEGGSMTGGDVVLSRWLDLPDGLSLSADQQWLAVSSHDTHASSSTRWRTAGDADPVAVLRGARYPPECGSSARTVTWSSPAGAPRVHVFARPHGGWRGIAYPTFSLRVVDDERFARGHLNLGRRGGAKGVDVHAATEVLVVTNEEQPLAFFDLGAAVDAGADAPTPDALLEYELHVLERFAASKAAGRPTRRSEGTMLFRAAAPVRRAYATVRGLLSRNGRN